MTPAARIAAAIELLGACWIRASRPTPSPTTSSAARRFIGSGDRRAVAERVWSVLRTRRRLAWWLARVEAPVTPRLLVAASLLLDGGGRGDGREVLLRRPVRARRRWRPPSSVRCVCWRATRSTHPEMPEAVALEVPDWLLTPLAARFGGALAAELAALAEPAPLDLRVNLLKATREEAQASLAAEGVDGGADAALALGPARRRARRSPPGAAFRTGWSRSRTRAASSSSRWWTRGRASGSPTGAPAPAARRWRSP